jgi:hypothetical protein
MLKADSLVRQLDPSVRSVAFERLLNHFSADGAHEQAPNDPEDQVLPNDGKGMMLEEFFAKHTHDKPHENVQLVAAWHLSQEGNVLLTQRAISQTGNQVGLVLPDRIDKTMETARQDGKAIFQKVDGGFRITVHGQLLFKKRYSVAVPKAISSSM